MDQGFRIHARDWLNWYFPGLWELYCWFVPEPLATTRRNVDVPALETISTLQIRVISKNIRYATTNPFPGEVLWKDRKDRLINELIFNSLGNESTLICCQEVLHSQLIDIEEGLNELGHWNYVGWGRDDGEQAGEYSPIFYQSSAWQAIESNPVWLSKTPHKKGSKYPGAGSVRILTRSKLRHVGTSVVIIVYCTHLDDSSSEARQYAAELICELALEDSKFPIILAGDFNSETNQEAYQTIIKSGLFDDVRHGVNQDGGFIYGNTNTFTGFGPGDGPPKRIDYVFTHDVYEPLPIDKAAHLTVWGYVIIAQ